MRTRRMMTAWAVFVGVAGSVGGTIGYGAYHQSEFYRRRVERWVAQFFQLPADVGAVRPRSFNSRELLDVHIWLPQRRDLVFKCPSAILENGGGNGGTLVMINEPLISIGSEQWEREDYIKVLRGSLAHNFRSGKINVREVRLNRARILWPRSDFRMSAEGVEGSIVFDENGLGDARLASRTLNGTTVSEPVQILARLDPSTDDLLPEVVLTVPPLPLSVLGLNQVLGSTVTQGTFAGRITLLQSPDGDQVRLSGSARGVKLEELTHRSPGGPVAAVVDLQIDEAVLRGEELERLEFSGEIRQLDVEPLLAHFGLAGVGGRARLSVRDAQVTGEGIEHLSFSGEWLGAAVDPLVRLVLGNGGIQGRLLVRVHSLVVRDNELVGADADVQVLPPDRGPGTIDRGLLLSLLQKQAGLAIPERLLPETIEFTQMSARLLLVDSARLRILSTQGSAGPPVITAKLLGRELPLLADLDYSVDVRPLQQELKRRISDWRATVKQRIQQHTSSPSRD